VSLTPVVGSGDSARLIVKASDPDGGADVSQIYVLVNSGFSGQNACYSYYHKPTRAVWLLNDAGAAAAGYVPLASAGTVSNSQCSVLGVSNSDYPSSGTIEFDLTLSFSKLFSGIKSVYVMAEDASGLNSGWVGGSLMLP
jgi:hypothetical protein